MNQNNCKTTKEARLKLALDEFLSELDGTCCNTIMRAVYERAYLEGWKDAIKSTVLSKDAIIKINKGKEK